MANNVQGQVQSPRAAVQPGVARGQAAVGAVEKKPFWKKWWVWAVLIVLVLIVVGLGYWMMGG